MIKILESRIKKLLAWTKRHPVTKTKTAGLTFPKFHKIPEAMITDCPLIPILFFFYST